MLNCQAKKSLFLCEFCLTEQYFLVLVFLTMFNGLSATTSQSPMSKLVRFSESLGKSNGKKWSHSLKKKLIKGVKSPRNYYFFSPANFALLAGFFLLYWCYYQHWLRDALSPVCGIFTNSALWAELVRESTCPCVCLSV